MKVRVAVHGRFHAFELARGLYRLGHLERLQTTYPSFVVRRIVGKNLPLITVPHLELQRRLGARLGFSKSLGVSTAKKFARSLSRSLHNCHADILAGWSSATLEAIPIAHDRGMRVVIERGSTHILHQTRILKESHQSLGLSTEITPEEIIDRELAEYEAADAIVVPSQIAANTFSIHGISADKVFVNQLGVDRAQFSPPPDTRHNDIPVILFVGTLSVRKGMVTLLEAIAKLDRRAELRCVGPIDPDFRRIFNRLTSDRVTLLGPVSRNDVHNAYRSADIFCLPSVEEGFGMAVAEAMASGLPVVVSDQVGAADLISDGEDGLIVPHSNADALAEALTVLIDDKDRRQHMGKAAALKACSSQSWDDYIDRAVTIYEKVLG